MSENYEFKAVDLVPRYWSDVEADTLADILFLGKITIGEMVVSWDRVAAGLTRSIKNIGRGLGIIDDLDLIRVLKNLGQECERLAEKREETIGKIQLLHALEADAEKKPPLPAHRPYHWFIVGNTVVAYTIKVMHPNREEQEQCSARSTFSYKFVEGTLISSIYGGINAEICLTCDGKSRFEIIQIPYLQLLHHWELTYLKEHPNFAKLWFGKEIVL